MDTIHPGQIQVKFCLVFLIILALTSDALAKELETQHLTVTVQANWSGCDGDCDSKQSGNHVNSGGYTLNITGTVKTKKGGKDFINYEPESLTGTCFVHSTTTTTSEDCQKCNPVETLKGTRTVTFGKDNNAIATLQAFMGQLGAGFAQQLSGEFGPGYEKTLASLTERRIISFSALVPVTLIRTEKDCKSCLSDTERGESGFAVSINADMITRKTGVASWKSKTHPLSPGGASVIDLGGEQKLGPERDQQGRAQFNVTWSLGEAEPAKLKIKKIFFNYDANKETAVQLKSEKDDSKITAPEWTASDIPKPAAFVRDTVFKVKALFGVEGERIEKAEIWAEEEVMDGGSGSIKKGFKGIKKKTVTFSSGETEKEVEFSIEAPQSVITANRVKWFWKANVWYKGSQDPVEVEIKTEGPGERGYTEHTIYIVGGKPVPKTTAYVFVVKKGCQWAEGETGGDGAFQAIWNSFWNIQCPADTRCSLGAGASGILSYDHGEYAQMTTIGLLQEGKGRCGGWQEFFADMMGSQGVKVEKYTIYPKSDQYGIVSMIVGRGMAQGNVDPKRAFTDHAIVKYGGLFYDPSYWTSQPVGPGEAIATYEEKTFVAYCTSKKQKPCVEKCNEYDRFDSMERTEQAFSECLLRECDCLGNDPFRCEVNIIQE